MTRRRLLWVFLPFAGGYFLSYLYRTVNAVIAPDLTAALGLTAAGLGLLTSAYFLTFALFQLPLGMLLDRYGPRRVEAALLLLAVAGALLFALSQGLAGLILGRALIGLGVSACLMASFKAFVIWFPAERLPAVNGWVMGAGGLGALVATAPVEAMLHLTGWRGLFLILALLTLAVAAAVFFLVPEAPQQRHGGGLREQLRGVREVFGSRTFWQVAPMTLFSQAGFLAIQGLWAGPWLRDVAGLERPAAATVLLLTAAAMVAGYLSIGNLAYRLSRFGIRPIVVAGGGMTIFMGVQLGLVLHLPGPVLPLWMAFGFFGTAGILPYAVLSQAFAPHLAGRVNTAINLLVFVVAFAWQWGIGAVINLWPVTDGRYHPAGYQAAFALVLALQAAGVAWFVLSSRRQR
ncbi:MAG: MFS transporter [Pseudomonadota bacterium]|nr:MFS transporter [Pseudomonadota bacterium]